MASTEKKGYVIREEIGKVFQQIKDGNGSTYEGLAESLGVNISESRMIIGASNAWIHREKVDNLIKQLRTGNLEGLEPVASLDGGEK